MEKEILEKIKKILGNQLGINEENIKMESTFVDDLAADSLDIVELVMAIEEEFGVSAVAAAAPAAGAAAGEAAAEKTSFNVVLTSAADTLATDSVAAETAE